MAETKTKTKTATKSKAKTKAPDKIRFIRIQYFRSAIATPTKHKLVVKGPALRALTRSWSAWTTIRCGGW